jgi:hypothetical protein
MQAPQFVERVHARATELAPDSVEIARLSDADPDVVELVASLTADGVSSAVEEIARQIVHATMREHRLQWMTQTQCHGQWRPMERPVLSKDADFSPETEHRVPLSVSHHADAMQTLRQQQRRMRERAEI